MAYPKSTALLILLLFSSLFPSSSFSLNLLHQSISSPLSLRLSLAPSLFLSRSLSISLSLPLPSPPSPFLVPALFLSRSPSLSLWFPLSFSLVSSLSLFVSRSHSFSHATNRLIEFYSQTRRLESACGVRERENERSRVKKMQSEELWPTQNPQPPCSADPAVFFPPSLFPVPSPFPSLFLSRSLSLPLSLSLSLPLHFSLVLFLSFSLCPLLFFCLTRSS